MNINPITRPSYNFLLEFYLRENLYGVIAEFNKTYFPESYKAMLEELEKLQMENKQTEDGNFNPKDRVLIERAMKEFDKNKDEYLEKIFIKLIKSTLNLFRLLCWRLFWLLTFWRWKSASFYFIFNLLINFNNF